MTVNLTTALKLQSHLPNIVCNQAVASIVRRTFSRTCARCSHVVVRFDESPRATFERPSIQACATPRFSRCPHQARVPRLSNVTADSPLPRCESNPTSALGAMCGLTVCCTTVYLSECRSQLDSLVALRLFLTSMTMEHTTTLIMQASKMTRIDMWCLRTAHSW